MSQKKKMMLYGILTIVWSGVIFTLSLQPANQSANLSGGMLTAILKMICSLTGDSLPFETAHHLFRKLAHFGEFFILGSFAYGFITAWKKPFWFAGGYCALIACTDEVIQFFTGEGRAMRLFDVGIDMLGAFSAILFWGIITLLFRKKSQK